MAIDSMLLGLAQIRATPPWEDARTQFSAVLTRYCEMVDQSPTLNASQIRPAWAELAETQEISDIATARLAARLGFPSE